MWTLAISKPESIHSFYKFCHITSIQSDCEENISLRILLQYELLSVRERGKAGETQHLLFSCNQGSSSGVPPIFSHFYLCVFPSVIVTHHFKLSTEVMALVNHSGRMFDIL